MGRSGTVVVLVFLISCSGSSEDIMKRSGELHDLSVNIGEHVEVKLRSIEKHAESMKGLERRVLLDSVIVLDRDLAEWNESLIEVPGHEHKHHEVHEHHHDPPPDLTPKMILEIQREINRQIIQLNIRSQRLLDQLEEPIGIEL